MIATGGLLRISARRQDSLHAKNRAENKRKRKAKKKRKNEVVVVKGKLKLCSVSGLVAGFGLLVLLVGVSMAVLGYWPKENPLYPELLIAKNTQRIYDGGEDEFLNVTINSKTSWHHLDKDTRSYNRSNGTAELDPPRFGAFATFINTHLHSDKLKVFGPLIMGIGIFLFICANAVLHENRDKKTKIINLRDIYSTVIDIHSLRSKESAPLNGFLNYRQSKESKSSPSYSAGPLAKGSWPSPGSGSVIPTRRPSSTIPRVSSLERPSFTDTVYSIYRDQNRTEPGPKTIVSTSVNAFTLPMMKANSRGTADRRGSDKTGEAKRERLDAEAICRRLEDLVASRTVTKAKVETRAELLQDSVEVYRSSASSQVQLLPPSSPGRRAAGSHVSLSALSDYSRSIDLGICPSTPTERQAIRSRRLSCPRLEGLGCGGYTKLEGLGGESFESTDNAVFSRASSVEVLELQSDREEITPDDPDCGVVRQYSNKQKLIMVSQSDATLENMDNVEI